MAKRGVKSIKGPSSPKVGQTVLYKVTEFFPETPENLKSQVKWELFRKRADGKYTSTQIIKTGPSASFNFGEKSVNINFKIVGYLFTSELTGSSVIHVKPSAGPASITGLSILDSQGKKITKTPKYGHIVTISVSTVNMLGEDLNISLWERDTISDEGHDKKENTKLWEGKATVERKNGVVKIKKRLTLDMAIAADKGLFEGTMHEYYAVVESEKLRRSSYSKQQVEVSADTSNYKVNSKAQEVIKAQGIEKQPQVAKGNSTQTVGQKTETVNCGEKFCIKIGDKSELIREINIRLSGFGGNVPTDEFTQRTQKMIKQFQRDYMKVPETGKICGNVLRAIDDFQAKFKITFDDMKCNCGTCKGFGKGLYKNEKQKSSIAEKVRKYEYPGIHRSLLWALRSAQFYTSNVEKGLKYTVRSISSGYRCHENNRKNRRSSTNHMGKAIDIHFNKNGVRTKIVKDIEDIRLKIFNAYLGAKWDWKETNIFNLESTKVGATTWVHIDVREFDVQYLDDKYFIQNETDLNGKSILSLAKVSNPNTCTCMGGGSAASNTPSVTTANKSGNYTEDDAKAALKIIFNTYGREYATIIEKMYRLETAHFKSSQYKNTGTGGMEAHGQAPYYGWDTNFFESNPEFKPMGLWSAYENAGLSGVGGNAQVKSSQKKFVILPSVLAGMEYKAQYFKRHNGNYARWFSKEKGAQDTYKETLKTIKSRIVDQF